MSNVERPGNHSEEEIRPEVISQIEEIMQNMISRYANNDPTAGIWIIPPVNEGRDDTLRSEEKLDERIKDHLLRNEEEIKRTRQTPYVPVSNGHNLSYRVVEESLDRQTQNLSYSLKVADLSDVEKDENIYRFENLRDHETTVFRLTSAVSEYEIDLGESEEKLSAVVSRVLGILESMEEKLRLRKERRM